MEKELKIILEKLKRANTEKNKKTILKYVEQLNKLWDKNSYKIKENAKKDGYHPPS